ncbi:ABC transporter B family member 6, putative [Plasmodium gallinaceum]|uniref:ABC transporter, (Heavy metal transporter family), putative n=1 Tax=Plasmodium gallinaceum TaxID=5849 RepID=A0A1J1GS23_PLAGA|nr:ABC transporter B family member 6, putative [Plasmodium gallinaceum]CRG95227.1 ABC transporter B family member 6, putative [Plasmodium gallinaceum]
MQSYKYLNKKAVLPQNIFCQYVSTLNKNISYEDRKRNSNLTDQIYFTLVNLFSKKKKSEYISIFLKNIFFSYIYNKLKKKNLFNTTRSKNHKYLNFVDENNKLFELLQNISNKTCTYNISLSFIYINNVKNITSFNSYFFLVNNITKKTRKYSTLNYSLNFFKENVINLNHSFHKRIIEKCKHLYLIRKEFLSYNEKENLLKKNEKNKNNQDKKDDNKDNKKKKDRDEEKNNNEDEKNKNDKIDKKVKNDEIEEEIKNDKYKENIYYNEKETSKLIANSNFKNNFNDEYEKIKVKELDKILFNLEKLYKNKNSKININIKILVYIFKNFIHKNKELKIKIFFSFIFLICSKISIIYTPIFLSSFIENVNLQRNLGDSLNLSNISANNSSFILLSAYVLSRVISSSLNELRNSVFNNISQRISTYVSKLFFYKIHSLDLSYILSKKNGELSFIFNRGCKSITNLLNVIVFQIIPIIIEFVLYLYILTYKIHYSVSIVTCLNMLLYIIFTTLVTKRRTIIRKNMNKAEQNTFNIFLDSIQNIEQVKYYTNEIHELKKFLKEQKKYEKEAVNVQKSLSFLNFGQQIILNFNLFLCLYLTYLNISNDVFPFSYLVLVNTLLFQLAIPLNMFGTIYRETKLSLVDIECMIKILAKKIKSVDYGSKMDIQNGLIKFENVYFRYPLLENTKESEEKNGKTKNNIIKTLFNNTKIFLKKFKEKCMLKNKSENNIYSDDIKNMSNEIKNNLNHEIKKNIGINLKENNYLFENFTCRIEDGEKVAVIGKSGSGKSSLIKLLLKFYELNGGNIYIDNKNIDNINLYTLRKSICVVPQDTILFNNTISYNIKYGNFHCSNEEMIEASIKSELHDKILKMENKYDTIVGERGTKLSIGEKQRICIARCFLKNSKIIVLDEHASNLDNENKKSIEKALNKLCMGKTTIIITHTMENLKNMNKIIFFCGKNIYVGSHQELIDNNSLYKEYYNSKNNRIL